MNLVNTTKLAAGLTISTDSNGYEHLVAIAKASYSIDDEGKCVTAEQQQEVIDADVYHGEPGQSSIRYESDYALHKPKADIILNGSAYAPDAKPAPWVDVRLQVSSIDKSMRVFGDRVWRKSVGWGYSASEPLPFTTMPLTYERAFGGCDISNQVSQHHRYELRNLVGVGLWAKNDKAIENSPLPNLERRDQLIHSPTDSPAPIGFGFVSRNWQPRVSYAGTYGAVWLEDHYPFLPNDFDSRYYQGAPSDQTCEHLRGGEHITLTNLTAKRRLTVEVPSDVVAFYFDWGGSGCYERPVLDTVILESDRMKIVLVWRATVLLRVKPTHLRKVVVLCGGRGLERAIETGKRYLASSGQKTSLQ